MDFKSFKNTRPEETSQSSQADLRKTAEKYGKKSDEELLGEIIKAANQGKRDGTLSAENLDTFAQNVAPMLNEEQKQRLYSVIKMINGN